MARIAGVNLPTAKRVEIALTYIHGIGNTKAKEITAKLGIEPARDAAGTLLARKQPIRMQRHLDRLSPAPP